MRYLLLMLAVTALVGCGEKAVEIDYGDNNPKAKSAIEKEINYRANIRGEPTKSDLMKVKVLSLPYNEITDLSFLAGLAELEELYLGSNQLTDGQLKHLAGFRNLRELYLSDNKISDISTLSELTKLRVLDLRGCLHTKTEFKMLEKALPDCFITDGAKK